MLTILKHITQQGQGTGCFVDVGANVGQTLIKLRAVHASYPYLGFEPNPTCNHYLNALMRVNDLGNASVIPAGIGSETAILELSLFGEDDADSRASMIPKFRGDADIARKLNIPVVDFTVVEERVERIAILKIDVEGAELEVVNSLKNRLRKDRPLVLIEVLPAYNNENTFRLDRQGQIEAILGEIDFAILRVRKNDDAFAGLERISEFGVHGDLNACDYILSPNERADELMQDLGSV